MDISKQVITILGSAGGVANAILSILNKSAQDKKDPIHHQIKKATIHLIDSKQKEAHYYSQAFQNIKNQFILHEFDLKDMERFKKHLR